MTAPDASQPPIVVIGAGLAGLACAARLVSRGRKVRVLEATSHGGGRTRSFSDTITGRTIDNGQHLMMGCYRETKQFMREIGSDPEEGVAFQKNLAIEMIRPGGKRVSMHCPALPAPLHLAAGLLGMRGMGPLNKLAALRAGLLLNQEVSRPDDNETCDAWLNRMGQTAAMRHAFWEPLIWATLNDDPLVSSAAMLMAVLDRAFLGTRDASRLGVPKRPLSALYVPQATKFIESHGSSVEFSTPVRQIRMEEGRVVGVTTKRGEQIDTDTVVSTVGPHLIGEMLPDRVRAHVVFRDIERLQSSPIVNLWAMLDRSPFPGTPFVGLIQSPIHWLFDRDQIEDNHVPGECLLSVTISGARAFIADDSDGLKDLLAGELARYFPKRPVQIRGFRVVKEKRATIGHAAGSYHWRPEPRTPFPGLFLGGDWVRTGLPATIESAVQSGHDVAAALVG